MLDWSLIRSVLAVAEAGSLSAAARATGISQPTLGRHIHQAEAALKVTLFTRLPRGLAPTEAALALLPAARAMQVAAADLARAAAARDDLNGTVRLTASHVISQAMLPGVLARLRQEAPGIEIDLIPSDATENLLFGQADIALRMYRPGQLGLVTRHLTDLSMGLYAARSLLDRHGRPETPEALFRLPFIGQDRDDRIIRLMTALGHPVDRGFFPVRTDDPLLYQDLIRAGCGVGGLLCRIGDAEPGLERIAPFIPLPALPVWLTAIPALRQSVRLRRVWDALAAAFAA